MSHRLRNVDSHEITRTSFVSNSAWCSRSCGGGGGGGGGDDDGGGGGSGGGGVLVLVEVVSRRWRRRRAVARVASLATIDQTHRETEIS